MPAPTFETHLKAFERHLCKDDLSSSTFRVYVHDLKVFGQWLGEVYGNNAASLDKPNNRYQYLFPRGEKGDGGRTPGLRKCE